MHLEFSQYKIFMLNLIFQVLHCLRGGGNLKNSRNVILMVSLFDLTFQIAKKSGSFLQLPSVTLARQREECTLQSICKLIICFVCMLPLRISWCCRRYTENVLMLDALSQCNPCFLPLLSQVSAWCSECEAELRV